MCFTRVEVETSSPHEERSYKHLPTNTCVALFCKPTSAPPEATAGITQVENSLSASAVTKQVTYKNMSELMRHYKEGKCISLYFIYYFHFSSLASSLNVAS